VEEHNNNNNNNNSSNTNISIFGQKYNKQDVLGVTFNASFPSNASIYTARLTGHCAINLVI
jgi:hypothetical protein